MNPGTSWGRWPRCRQRTAALGDRFSRALPQGILLPFGNGRSYGDVCLNDGGTLLATRGLDRFIRFDPANGQIECEAGVLLSEIIELVLGHGWFLPVTPGTSFVTVGGAIANDVHGKNHHRSGSFGNHVVGFELQRSDGRRLYCSARENEDWFAATIGGLGLTGLIVKATLQLRRVPGPWVRGDSRRFGSLDGFFAASEESDRDYEYTVAWIDCAAAGSALGRGIFMRGNHSPAASRPPSERRLKVPFAPPVSLINTFSLRAFNWAYYHRSAARADDAIWHYRPFFYPLDAVLQWNLIYGPKGFFQYQCAIPVHLAHDAVADLLKVIARHGGGSFLAVLKMFGSIPSRGLMSFPRPGATLALDFPNRGRETLRLLDSLDEITRAAGGAVYPAKDARMAGASFRQYFPNWKRFADFIDPRFSSSFWRRVMREEQ